MPGIRGGEAVFLFVRRFRKYTRGYNIRDKATDIFAGFDKALPEFRFLQEAREVFQKFRTSGGDDAQMGKFRTALIKVGENVFEEGQVRLPAETSPHLKIREGIPHEEIIQETLDGRYDLVMLGVHHEHGCHWYDIEHIPLSVTMKTLCPVMIIQETVEPGQPVLVCAGRHPISRASADFIQRIATELNSHIEVVTVRRSEDDKHELPGEIRKITNSWIEQGINVSTDIRIGDPLDVIAKMTPDYGLVICMAGGKKQKKQLGKLPRHLLCNRVNLLIFPPEP